MQKTALVIMAAGIGSRFGKGIKQLAPVGPCGEIIMDYSIHDAIKAGFNKIVFVGSNFNSLSTCLSSDCISLDSLLTSFNAVDRAVVSAPSLTVIPLIDDANTLSPFHIPQFQLHNFDILLPK